MSDDLISRQAAIDAIDECYCGGKDSCGEPWIYKENAVEAIQMIEPIPSAQPEPCEDVVPRASVEYICRKNTVSTNPYEHEHHEKFIKFMDDPEIADFGRWQHSNGFNTALVAVKCDLDKVPSVTPKQRTGKWIDVNVMGMPAQACDQCNTFFPLAYTGGGHHYCPNCGAKMEVTE